MAPPSPFTAGKPNVGEGRRRILRQLRRYCGASVSQARDRDARAYVPRAVRTARSASVGSSSRKTRNPSPATPRILISRLIRSSAPGSPYSPRACRASSARSSVLRNPSRRSFARFHAHARCPGGAAGMRAFKVALDSITPDMANYHQSRGVRRRLHQDQRLARPRRAVARPRDPQGAGGDCRPRASFSSAATTTRRSWPDASSASRCFRAG